MTIRGKSWLLVSCLLALGRTGASAKSPYVVSPVTSAEVQGFVFYADGQTPAVDVPVRLYDIAHREFIYHTMTDDFGSYVLPRLEPGRYFLTFDWLKLELEVKPLGRGEVQQPHDVIVIIPRGLASLSISQLTSLLLATTLTQAATLYESPTIIERPPVVSP